MPGSGFSSPLLRPHHRALTGQPYDYANDDPINNSDPSGTHFCIGPLAPTKRGSCHLFRHTVATLMLDGGADIRYVGEMLGHAKLETTQIYTRVSIAKLRAVHAATHPAGDDHTGQDDEHLRAI